MHSSKIWMCNLVTDFWLVHALKNPHPRYMCYHGRAQNTFLLLPLMQPCNRNTSPTCMTYNIGDFSKHAWVGISHAWTRCFMLPWNLLPTSFYVEKRSFIGFFMVFLRILLCGFCWKRFILGYICACYKLLTKHCCLATHVILLDIMHMELCAMCILVAGLYILLDPLTLPKLVYTWL